MGFGLGLPDVTGVPRAVASVAMPVTMIEICLIRCWGKMDTNHRSRLQETQTDPSHAREGSHGCSGPIFRIPVHGAGSPRTTTPGEMTLAERLAIRSRRGRHSDLK